MAHQRRRAENSVIQIEIQILQAGLIAFKLLLSGHQVVGLAGIDNIAAITADRGTVRNVAGTIGAIDNEAWIGPSDWRNGRVGALGPDRDTNCGDIGIKQTVI